MTLIFILHQHLGECVYKEKKIHVQNTHGTTLESIQYNEVVMYFVKIVDGKTARVSKVQINETQLTTYNYLLLSSCKYWHTRYLPLHFNISCMKI